MTCGATAWLEGLVQLHCERPSGHEGKHKAMVGYRVVEWYTDAEVHEGLTQFLDQYALANYRTGRHGELT